MRKILLAVLVTLLSAACHKKPDFSVKVLIGGTAIAAPGAAPIEDSIIVIGQGKIRAVGVRKDVPVPQASDRTDIEGEWVVPIEGSRIEVGETANLMILKHAPNGIMPAAPGDVGARLLAGEWETRRGR